ncbi:MAG TPA: hypothetical protein VMW56_01670 [Candidatus Margulisiibacteriota bacterium]|nr:hypothetical protein [Candidatus Margulisiibacteriota bacterium]
MPTPTGQGPQILYAGIVRSDYCVFCCDVSCARTPTPTPAFDAQGRQIFKVGSGAQFVIVVEAAAGLSGVLPGRSLTPVPPSNRSDLQIESTSNLGANPTTKVCDTGPAPQGGGIPGINPPSFDDTNQMITDALNDFGCRFGVFNVGSGSNATGPCTKVDATQDPQLVTRNAPPGTVQFCDQVATVAAFPPGDSVVTVKVRDANGNLGPSKQIVIRVATPKPGG